MRQRAQRTLKDKLLKKQHKAQAQEITQFGELGCEFMGMPAVPIRNLSKAVQNEITDGKLSANKFQLNGLVSQQINYGTKFMLMHQNVFQEECKNSWVNKYYTNESEFKTYINPKIVQIPSKSDQNRLKEEWEFNPSFPLVKILGFRYENIGVTYYNESMDMVEEELSGFPARVFQHYLDQLYGKDILDWRVNHGQIEPADKEAKIRFPKFFKIINEFTHKAQSMKEDYPELFEGQSLLQLNSPLKINEKTSWEDDLNKRLLKNIRKDLRILLEDAKEGEKESDKKIQDFTDF